MIDSIIVGCWRSYKIFNARGSVHTNMDAKPTFERQSGFNPIGKKASEAVGAVEPFWFIFYNDVLLTRQPTRTENHLAAVDRWYSIYAP